MTDKEYKDREQRTEELLAAYRSIFVDCSENYKAKRGFIEGANYQAERMYSEEDVLDAWELGAREGLPLTRKKKEELFKYLKKK